MPGKSFEEYKTKRELWMKCLGLSDNHGIYAQLLRMVWNDAAFRMINEARGMALPTENGGVKINRMMHQLINESFFAWQMMAIRRLTDTHFPIAGHLKGYNVYSLTSLLEDMEKNVRLLTRANIFEANGWEYDYEKVRREEGDRIREYMARIRDGLEEGGQTSSAPHRMRWEAIKEVHERLDWMSGANEESRSPNDTLRAEIFRFMREKIRKKSEAVCTYVDKRLAHAEIDAKADGITLNHLWDAHKVICQVAHFISMDILPGATSGFLAFSSYDQFAHIEKPLIDAKDVPKLKDSWRQYEDETRAWREWGIEELKQELDGGGNVLP